VEEKGKAFVELEKVREECEVEVEKRNLKEEEGGLQGFRWSKLVQRYW